MVMIVHQAVRQQTRIKPLQRRAEDMQKSLSVLIVFKDGLAPVASRSDLVKRTGKFNSQGTGHRLGRKSFA